MAGTETLELSTAAERAEELVRFLGGSDEQLLSTLAAFLPAGRYAELFTAVLERQGEVFKNHSDEGAWGRAPTASEPRTRSAPPHALLPHRH